MIKFIALMAAVCVLTWLLEDEAFSMSAPSSSSDRLLKPVVEAEQDVYAYTNADNGAGPTWCYGNTCIVRSGDKVFASGIKTLPDYAPLNNVRWMLFENTGKKWSPVADGGDTHEREPCPLVVLGDQVFLSTNPNACAPSEKNGRGTPQVLQFEANEPLSTPKVLIPTWCEPFKVQAHTYRSFAADRNSGEMILFYNVGYQSTYWTFRDANGQWSSQGKVDYPWGAEYDKPQPARVCYPTVELKDRAAYFCGVSDIVEPYKAWQDYKKQLSGKDWDYDFRRLFYTWSDDVTTGKFHPWVEIASRDKTCGWITPCDLWVGPDKRVHILWREKALNEKLRAKFFPDAKDSLALNYAIVQDGKVVLRKPILQWDEGQKDAEKPGRGRFHVTPDGRLLVLYYTSGSESGKHARGMRLVEIGGDGALSEAVNVPVKQPMEDFFTAGVRSGSAPSMTIDILGQLDHKMRYCRIRLK